MAAPQLISTNLTGSTGFDGREALRLTFSEPIQAGSGWVSIYKNDGTLVERLSIATSSRVSLAGPVLTITPTWALESSANHYLTIDAGAVRDANGNGYAGLTTAQPLRFRTGAESLNNTVEEPFRNNFPGNGSETIGEHSWLFIRTTYADQLNAPWSEWTDRTAVATNEAWWAINSNGRLSITNTFAPLTTHERTTAWHRDLDQGAVPNANGVPGTDARTITFNIEGIDFSNFDAGVYGNNDWTRANASWGGGRFIFNGWTGWGLLAHEGGHEIGFGHPIKIAGPFDPEENKLGWEGHSRMGGGPSHYGLQEKLKSGWIDRAQVLTDPEAGNYRITAFDLGYTQQPDIYGFYINSTAPGFDAAGFDWTVQYRSQVGMSDSLILIRSGGNARLDDPIQVGETYRIVNSNTYITNLSQGNNYLETAVRFGAVGSDGRYLDNAAPVVAFTANARAVKTGESATFSANAYDSDGNALTYTWSFSDGVTGQGAIFSRSFNQSTAGTVTVTLTANDLRGGIVSTSAAIAVGAAARDSTPLTAGGSLPAAATRSKPLVTLQSRDAFADEAGDTATLVLERFGTSLDSSLTVALAYSGSGVNDVTSGSKPATITFAPGQKTVEFQVSMLDDTAVEPVERLTVSLAANSAYDISGSDGSSWVTLYDNDLPKVRVEAIDAVASEGGRDFGTFLISRTGPLDAPLKVYYNQYGTALYGSDYAALPGEITIAAGQRSAVVTIVPIDNDAGEPVETVSLILTDFSDLYDVDPTAHIATIQILDNDKPQVQAYVTGNVTEGGIASITVEAQGRAGDTVTVRYALSGTATSGSDYIAPSGSINVIIGADGIGTSVVRLQTLDDTLVEAAESVVLTILESEDYGIGTDRQAAFVLRDNDGIGPVVMISPFPDTATEGDGNKLRFYVERSGTSGDLVVNYQLLGTATPNVDYTGLSGSVTIPNGAPGVILELSPLDDALEEGQETVTVKLTSGNNYQLGIATTATLRIDDNDTPYFGVGFADASTLRIAETQDPNTNIRDIVLKLEAAPLLISTGTGNGVATLNPASGAVGVGQSFTTSTLGRRDRLESITIQGPSSGGESRQLTLKVWKNNGDINTFAPGALVATSTNSAQLATGQAVQFQFSGEQLDPNAVYLFSMSEGAANHVRFRSAVTNAAGQRLENGRLFSSLTDQSYDVAFTLNLKEPANAGSMPTVPVSAQIGTWAGTNHTAFGGNIDYTFLDLQTNKPIDPPTVVFAPGETQKVVRIRVNPDGHTEGLEHFTLGFSSISGATTLPNAGQLRVEITDRTDAAVAAGVEAANRYVRFIAEQSALSEDAGSDPRLMVALDRPAGATPITLTLQVSGSATPGVDYTIASTSLTFQPGEIAKFIDHTLIADSIPEGLETILISLTNVSGALVADPKPYVFYLLDKDRPQLATSSGSTSSTAAAGSTVATLTANFATGRTAGSWQIVAGNVTREGQATPAFAIDNSGKVTLANPAALPANPLAVQLTVRVTDNLGAQSDNVVNLAVNGIANPVFAPYKVALVENSAIAVANLNTTVGTDSGLTPTISAGGRTRDKTLSLSGSADRNATVRIFNGSTLLGTAERQGDSWSFTTPELPDGQHTFTAQVSNAYGTTHITNAVTVNVSSILTAPAQRALLTNVDSLERISSQADLVLVEVADANGHGTNTTFTDGNTSVRDLLVADLKTGEVQLVNRGPAAALSSANVDVTLADVSNDGRYIAFSSTAATSFGQNGTAFTDTTPTSSQTDLFVYDRQTSQLRLATWSGNQTTTASRGATAVGITADSRYLIYSTDYIERIADFSAPGKMVWTLLDGSYATPTGVSKATAVRVADLNLSKLDIRLSGSSAGQPASVRLDTVTQAPGQVTFWAEGKGTSNAVRLQLTDTSNGIEVKALAARKVSLSTDVSISSGTSTGVATFSKLSTASGVGQTFTTDALTSGRRLSQITIQGPSGGAGTTQYSLKVWKNGGTFNDFAPTELVATSVNRSAIPNGQPTVFEFSGEALDPNTVYLFSFTDSSQDHVTFRASQASGLANGRVLAASASSSTDVQFTLGFSAAAAVQGSIDWNALSIAQPINTGTGSAQANLSRGGGVGQTFTTADLGNTDRLTSISIQGPSDSSTGAVYTLKVYENTGAFTSFSPGTLVATSTNTASLPNNTRSTFSFSGETLQSNKVYLFSLTDSSGNNHVGFRGSVTNAAATTLADGQLFSSLTNASTYDLAFSLNLASAAYVSGTAPYRVDGLSVATSSTTAGLGVSAINVGPLDTSSQMQSEIPTGNLAASRDLVAYELATGNQILLSHNAANNKASNAANVDQVAISADGRYVVFSALDATRLGNGGVAFTDADPLRADWFATNTQTGQIRLLTHASGNDNASAGAAVSWQGVGGKGSYAVFSTANAGAFGFTDDSPEVSDLLAVGLQDGVIRLITTNGPASPNVSNGQAISLLKISGDHVYFTANDATKFGFASDAGASQASLFRYDLSTGKLKLLSHAIGDTSAALAGAYVSNSLTVSPDGRYVAFALGTGTSSGGFSIPTLGGNPGHALFVTDTTTGNIRLVNSSYLSTTGTALSYASWADVGTKPRFFSGDGTKLIWQSDYLSYVGNGVTGGQYDDGVVLLNLANGVQPAGTAMPNRLLSPSATNPGSLSTGANATLVGVSKDGEFAYFTALNAAWFGNDGVAFTDAYPSVMDLFKVNLNTYRVELISGQNGVSSGQVASLRDVTEGGNLVYSLPSTTGSGIDLWTDVSTLIDLDSNDDTSGEVFGSSNDNITSKRSFTLRARVLPNQQVTLLDKGVAVPSGTVTATAQGDVSWTLQNVSLGQHTYSLLDTLQQAPIVLDGNPGNSSLVVTVLNALGANDRPATATLTVSGVAQEGGSLSASLSNLSDADGAITATVFQWQQRVGSSWVDLAGYGANTATLTIPADQSFVGKSVRVVVATTDALGGTTSFTGDTQSIANVDDAATGLLVVSGEAEVGGTLTASLSEVNDADGEIIATSFRWQQNTGSNAAPVWVDISGASTNTLEVGASLTARQVRVVATTTDELGGTTELTTVQTIFSAVDQAHITVTDSNTATNSVSEAAAIGTPVGLTVFASDEHADGEVFTMIYSLIDTAGGRFAINATTGVVTVAGTLNYSSASSHTIKVRASSSDGYQQEQSFTIAVTKANSLPTGSVSISGTPTQGQTLTAANTLADPDGIPSSGTGAIAYQWKANGTAISGATSSTYVLTQAEVGKAITVTASYTDNGGTAESVTSAATAAVAAPLPVITLGVSPTSVTEDGVPNLVYTFTRSGPTASPLTVNYTIGGSANALDYTGATPGSGKTISFDPGSSTATLVIDPTADAFFEADETVILTLVSASTYSVGTPGAVTGTITNDDALPTVRVTDASIPEGNSGTKNLNFLISLSTPSGQVVTVDYATANNTATAGSDYTSTSGSLTIQPGATSGVVSVPILGDTTAELDETFFLNLTNATGGVTIARGQAIGTIINDDGVGGLVLTGTSGPDTLTGSTTNDTLTGLAGADILDGQGGADTFVYTALTDSLLGGRDSLRSFNPGEGDRIKLPNLPTAVFYGGSVAASISAPAVSSAYAAAGAGGLAARGAVFFATGSGRTQRLYLSVNDGTAAFNPNSDLVMEVTGMVGAPSVVGSLTAANYFI